MRKALAVARGLRYRGLDALFGRRVCLFSEQTTIGDVLSSLADGLPAVEPGALFHGLALAKYGIVHLELTVTGAVELPRPSRLELRRLGVLVRSADPFAREAAGDFFDALLAEFAADARVLCLMLDVEHDRRTHEERVAHTYGGLPRSYFPRMARVRDACVTNAPSVWMYKHFYL